MPILTKERRFPSATKLCDIRCRFWIPEEPRLCLLIVHGMAEHIERYEETARYLAGNGVLVAGFDLPSHGRSRREDTPFGYFGENDGWACILKDIATLRDMLRAEYPQTAIVLFGHSMGSFLAQDCMARMGDTFEGFVLSGTSGPNPAAGFGRLLCKWEIFRGKGKQPSKLLNSLCFGSFSSSVKNAKTPVDWLSRDEKRVASYVEDPLCGFMFTPWGYYDMLTALTTICTAKWAAKVPDKPVLFLSGDADPVGQMGRGVRKVCENLKKTGHTHLEMKIYEGGRHEMHQEINRAEVYQDLMLFLESVCVQGEME